MKSVWYEMGMRDGAFRGTVPAAFMNCAYRFFLDLRDQCRKDLAPGYVCPEREKNFSFNARDKFGRWRGYEGDIYKKNFTFQAPPMGTPIPEELWSTSRPEWKKVRFTEEEILGEEIISYGDGPGYSFHSTEWEKQRYRLIQKMRYSLIPLQITFSTIDHTKQERWEEYYGNTGCIDREVFPWDSLYRLRVKIPDYWAQPGVPCKIGICAENLTSALNVPLNGCRWVAQKNFTTAGTADKKPWLGRSKLRIYAAVDLAGHPDYAKYFHQTQE